MGFSVVAEEVKNISERISKIASGLTEDLQVSVNELTALGQSMCFDMRGQRLADLSLNMIEIIDRNLYERTCDVRWWATDASLVDALTIIPQGTVLMPANVWESFSTATPCTWISGWLITTDG